MSFVQPTATTADCRVGPDYVTIDILPDEVLLGIFDFFICRNKSLLSFTAQPWVRLLHVCRRWRSIVLSAPLRLDLRIISRCRRPTKEIFDIWPTLPIALRMSRLHPEPEDNIIAALEYKDRISEIFLPNDSNNTLARITEAMEHPFPVLTVLSIWSTDQTEMVLPDSLLGGCAPRLRSLRLHNVAFPSLPKLLLSATGLVELSLSEMTHSEWITPEAMVDYLSLLTGLEQLRIDFKSSRRHLDRTNRRPHSTRTIHLTLTTLYFQGAAEYLDGLFASVDAPLLERVDINKLFDPPTFDVMRIASLTGLTETFEMPDQACMLFAHDFVDVMISSRQGTTGDKMLRLSMTWKFSDWYLTRAYYPSSPRFTIESRRQRTRATTQDKGRTHWLDLLCFFPTTENLYLFNRIALCIAFALQELSPEGATEVLPALQNLFIEDLRPSGLLETAIGGFIAARQLSGRPVAVQRWVRGHR